QARAPCARVGSGLRSLRARAAPGNSCAREPGRVIAEPARSVEDAGKTQTVWRPFRPPRPKISRQNFSVIAYLALNSFFTLRLFGKVCSVTHDHHSHPLCRTRLPPAERSGFAYPACD